MTDAEKIAVIKVMLHDLAKLSAFLAENKRKRWTTLPTALSEIAAAETHALHKVAEIVGVYLPLFTV